MADYGAKVADEAIQATERKLRETYATAEKELQKKLANFVARHKVKDAAKRKLLAQGKITQEEYDEWKRRQIFTKERWEAKAREVAHVMTDSNNQATKIINERRLNVFAENHNYMAYIGEQQLGVSFDIYSTESVARLIQEDPQVLPEWKIDEPKDYAWNYKKVNNIIQQGIIQGESIPDMAKRLCRDLSAQNENKMNMFARTAITGAQNAGRQRQMERAAAMGIEVKKQWLATLDSRTRDWHRDRDGETVPYNEKFSGGLEFPGDPTGKAGDVFNCRCTMVTVYPKYSHLSTDRTRLAYDEKDGKRKSYLTDSAEVFKGWSEKAYKRWAKEKTQTEAKKHQIVNGRDISDTWERRPDQFDFEIDDVINAQGFDGMPRAVSPEEFDRIAKDTEAICKRGYNVSYEVSGEDAQTVLDRYHEELLEGKWYVDCHVGGADYGQGMYSYVKHGNVTSTSKMDEAVKFYSGDNGRTEIFTFDKDMKIVKSSEIKELKKMEELSVRKSADKAFSMLDAEEKDIAERMAGIKPTWGKEGRKAIEKFGELSEERQKAIQNAATDYGRIVREETEHYKKMDDGVYAALKGYDAIEADYDLGDDTHELVILNRTKLIFRGR